jgi:ribonuclease P protein component
VFKENEENVSAEQQETQENARLPRPDEEQGRAGSPQEQTPQGQKTRFCLMDERLTPGERIRRQRDFLSLYKNGSRYRGRYFNLVYGSSPSGAPRLAVVVSKKVGPAVKRNRVKRRIRALFRRHKGLLPGPMDFVFVARKEILDLDTAELRAAYFQALESIKKKRASL